MTTNMKKVGITATKEKYATTYADAISRFGVEPVFVLPDSDPQILDTLDGVVFTGGSDINPAQYGEDPHPETQAPNDARDRLEIELLQKAIGRNMPVLAICRGLQMLNVVQGGTLVQHLDSAATHKVLPNDKSEPAHRVNVTPNSKLARILRAKTLMTNSRHHQAVGKLGKGLKVQALAEDGVIEGAVLDRKKFVVAVQWHPENELDRSEASRNLFQTFVNSL